MKYSIANDTLTLVVDTFACQMHSLIKDDIEYLWSGDEKYWKGRNPILFPFVGSTTNKVLNIKGQDISITNHGFARNIEFKFIDKKENYLKFELMYDDNTFKLYPYKFKLCVKYELIDNKVNINYQIHNLDEVDLPFGFGLHPAFNCPLEKDETFEDYKVILENDMFLESNEIKLERNLFKQYPTVLINDCKSNSAILKGKNHSVKINFKDFNIFAIWSPNDAPFVCLEPWLMQIDSNDLTTKFEDRKGIIKLKKDSIFSIGYSIEIN